MARAGPQHVLRSQSCHDVDVLLQPTGDPAVQLLEFGVSGYNGTFARHSPPRLVNYPLHLSCLTLSVLLLLMLTFFYARKNWKTYSKANLWLIFIVDVLIATLYNYDLLIDTIDEATGYLMTEIWIRPTITYGLVACFVTETNEK